jgi:hypothetical protein
LILLSSFVKECRHKLIRKRDPNLEIKGRNADGRRELALDFEEVDNGIVEASDSGTAANIRSSYSSREEENRANKGVDGSLDSVDFRLESSS